MNTAVWVGMRSMNGAVVENSVAASGKAEYEYREAERGKAEYEYHGGKW